MKKRKDQCRMRDEDNRYCRRPRHHRIHFEHDNVCAVPAELHHPYHEPTRIIKGFKGDPLIRSSVIMRRSMWKYLREVYGAGGMSIRLRELVADDMGVRESRLRHYVGGSSGERDAEGKFLPRAKVVDERLLRTPLKDEEPIEEEIVV